jgi:DNA-directed RNA polymerase subunit RPC12/RpoP
MIAETEDQILEAFRNTVPYRPECGNCGEKFFRKEFEKNLKESGVLEHVDSEQELAYMECPNCGTPQDFSL